MPTQSSDNNKRIAKNTLLLYFRMLFLLVVSLYTSRIVLNALGVVDYGLYNVVGGIVVMLGSLTGSLAGTSSRFITYELGVGDKGRMIKVFGNVILLHWLSAGIIFLLAETVGLWFLNTQLQIPTGREVAAFWVYQLSIISALISVVSIPYNAAIVAHERMGAFAYISILDAVMKLLAVFLLVKLPFDRLIVYAALLVLIQIVDRVIYGVYCLRHFEETRVKSLYDKKIFRSIFSYSLWTLNGSLAYFGFTQGLNILLNIFFGPAVNAARGIAVQVQGVCQQFCNNFQMALNPQLTKSYAQGNLDYMHSLVVHSSKFSYFILFFIVLPLMYESKLVLQIWLGVVPEHTVNFLRLVLIIGLLFTLSNPIITSVHATGNVRRFQMIEATMLLFIVPIAWILLKFFGVTPEAVFLVHIVIEVITQVVRLYLVCPMINFSKRVYFTQVIKPIALVTILAPILPYCVYIQHMSSVVSFFAVCTASVISCAVIMFYVGCTKHEREFLLGKVSLIFSKIKR